MAKKTAAKKPKVNVADDPYFRDFIRTQERLTEDYLGNPRGKRSYRSCEFTLVRDPQGNYWKISKHKKPEKVPDTVAVQRFLNDVNELLSDYLAHIDPRLVTGPGVHIGTAEIFPK